MNSISATIVPILVGYLIGNAANAKISDASPALFIAMGIFAVAFIVLSIMSIPEPHMEPAKAKTEKDTHSALSFRHFILGAVAIFLYVGVEVGIPNFLNLFLTTSPDASGATRHGNRCCYGRIDLRYLLVLDDGRTFVRRYSWR